MKAISATGIPLSLNTAAVNADSAELVDDITIFRSGLFAPSGFFRRSGFACSRENLKSGGLLDFHF